MPSTWQVRCQAEDLTAFVGYADRLCTAAAAGIEVATPR